MKNTPTNPPPTHLVYHVRDGQDQAARGFWTRIGAAWAHKDGKGVTVTLDLLPLDGRLVVREQEDGADGGA
jgi:hypothetical protein